MKKDLTTALFVQARMTSHRLPGKPLYTVLGKPLLCYQLERLKRVKNADLIAVLTTTNSQDNSIASISQSQGVEVFRGSEVDVLNRFAEAAKYFKPQNVVRITADCPLIDPIVIDQVIEKFLNANPPIDFASNTLTRTFPRGMDTEVFSTSNLYLADEMAQTQYEREHVTPYFYQTLGRFSTTQLIHEPNYSNYRLTVDTKEDFDLISKIIAALYPVKPNFNLQDIVDILQKHPEWQLINSHITQKHA